MRLVGTSTQWLTRDVFQTSLAGRLLDVFFEITFIPLAAAASILKLAIDGLEVGCNLPGVAWCKIRLVEYIYFYVFVV